MFDERENVFRNGGEDFAMLEGLVPLASLGLIGISNKARIVVNGFGLDELKGAVISQHGWEKGQLSANMV